MKNNCQKYKCFDRSRCYSSPFFGYCMDVMMVRPRIAKHESAKIKCKLNNQVSKKDKIYLEKIKEIKCILKKR